MKATVESGKYTLKTYQTSGVKLIESVYPAKLQMPCHTHDAASFCLVLEGVYEEIHERKSEICKPSTLTVYPAQHKHAVNFGNAKVRTLDAVIGGRLYERICENSSVMNHLKNVFNGETIYLANRLYREFNRTDEISALAVEGIILEILAASSRNDYSANGSDKGCPRWLKKVDEYLHEHFSEALNLEEIAAVAGVHSVHLTRVFRRQYKCTIGEYVRRLRIEFACRRISAANASFSEIALSAGFADQSHFARIFKAQ